MLNKDKKLHDETRQGKTHELDGSAPPFSQPTVLLLFFVLFLRRTFKLLQTTPTFDIHDMRLLLVNKANGVE